MIFVLPYGYIEVLVNLYFSTHGEDMSNERIEAGARGIFAKRVLQRATTRALIPTNRKRREKGVAKVKKKEDTP